MNEIEQQDDTWETFFGTSPDLMPSIMGAIDALLDENKEQSTIEEEESKTIVPKRIYQASNFTNLSANVQKILANVPDDDEIDVSDGHEQQLSHQRRFNRASYVNRSQRSMPDKKFVHKSNESLDIISPNVQKIISNLPDNELVIHNVDLLGDKQSNDLKNHLFSECSNNKLDNTSDNNNLLNMLMNCDNNKTSLYHSKSASSGFESAASSDTPNTSESSLSNKPLGSYMHKSPSGIASRTPVGRKNMGKFLQIPSESTDSTLSSEVSRPVSLTSLGSCSSSGSSGLHQQGSAYLASAESLDSDVEPSLTQGSADSGIAETTTMSPELRVLQEVLDTETIYVEDLRQVIQGYLEPWKNDPECPLQEHLTFLFSNLEEIYEFNRSFLQQLRTANCDPSQTANTFLLNDSGFSIYCEYCTSYPRTMNILTELTRDDKMASLFRERQVALGHALPLGSYLLKPVQRILKYHLLLQRLSKQCDSVHKPTVDLALTTMTSVATHINTMKRKHEHAVRVQEIQSQLYGWSGPDLTALGELIAEGTFRVGGARGRRHVFLFDKLLLMAKSKPDGALAYKTHIMCSNLMLVEQVRGEPLSFHVLPFDNPRQQCTLRARSAQHKREWTLQIKRVILENYSAVIPSHARQLVMQLGQDVEETTEENEKWSPIKQHSTPQYLERRSRVRKTRDFASRRAASQDRTFPSIANWRRKSDPNVIQQYTTKSTYKKPSKTKKAKDSGPTFYTDLSDSENCDVICASTDSLNLEKDQLNKSYEDEDKSMDNKISNNNLTIAQVVSDLLMQNEEFHKLLKRQKRHLKDNDGLSNAWLKSQDRKTSKADSLPRSFQINDQQGNKNENLGSLILAESSTSLQDKLPENEDLHENDLSSQAGDDYPEHKIYRKSIIRFSLLQRFRAILNEEQKKAKNPIYKQGSKNMGAKIANPDYVDPHKLFSSNSLTSSECNISIDQTDQNDKIDFDDYNFKYSDTDMTINEYEVLNELDKRLSQNSNSIEEENSNNCSKSSQSNSSATLFHISLTQDDKMSNAMSSPDFNSSSQNFDSFYESLLDKSLNEAESTIEKCDSFRSAKNMTIFKKSENGDNYNDDGTEEHKSKQEIKRPTKAPPPIPTKPKFLSADKTNTTRSSLPANPEIGHMQ